MPTPSSQKPRIRRLPENDEKIRGGFGLNPPAEGLADNQIPLLGGKHSKILANPWAIDAFCVKLKRKVTR